MLKVLAGTRKPAGGRVMLDGQELLRIPRGQLARRMAVVPQETHLAFDYSVLEVVLMGRYPHLGAFEIEGPRDYAAAREALAATGTAEFEERAFATLSGGEKQRVVIASALAQIASGSSASAPLLLLDEPTAALDLAYQLEIASLLRELRERMPLSIVLSTHDLNFAASLCTSLVLLKEGRVLASGPTERGTDCIRRPGAVWGRGGGVPARCSGSSGRHTDSTHARKPRVVSRTIRRQLVTAILGFGGLAAAAIVAAPLIGSTPHQSSPCARPLPAVCRQRRRPDPLRRPAAANARGRARRRRAGGGRRRLSGAAPQPARHAFHAGRLLRRCAWRDAGDYVRMDACRHRPPGDTDCQLRRIARRGRDRLCARPREARRTLHQHAAARRRDDERVFLGADPVRAVFCRLRRDLSHAAVADGGPRRQRLSAARHGAPAARALVCRLRLAGAPAQPAQPRAPTAPRRTASTSRLRSDSPFSARPSRPAPPSPSAAPLASSGSSSHTSCG